MVLFNYATKELTAKIVYYGPGLCGKTTNLQFIHQNLPETVKGKMLSLATKTDRTLFFDFLPLDLGEIRGMKTRVQLYTVPPDTYPARPGAPYGAGHCEFTPDSRVGMIELLDGWVRGDLRPTPQLVEAAFGPDSGYDADHQPGPWPE